VRRWARAALIAYLALLHAALAVLVFKTNFLALAGKTLGLIPIEERTTETYEAILDHARRAAALGDGSVVLLGDSIIAGLDAGAIGPGVANFGAAGRTSAILRDLVRVMPNLPRMGAVVLGIGTNDLRFRARDLIFRDQEQLLAAIPPGVPVLLLATLPVREGNPEIQRRPFLRNAGIAGMNEGLRRICAQRPGCIFVPTAPAMADDSGNLAEALHAGDGWHLSPEGSARLAALIRAQLPPAWQAGAR